MLLSERDLAFMKAQAVYCQGDSMEQASGKALENGYMPGTETYKAFICGFTEMIDMQ